MVRKIADSHEGIMPGVSPKAMQLNGEYIVTDGCYVLPDEVWQETVDFWDFDKNEHDWIAVEIDGHVIFMFDTAYGDGEYEVAFTAYREKVGFWHGGQVLVDSGTIALVPLAYNPSRGKEIVEDGLGVITKIDGEFKMDTRGVIDLGNIDRLAIDTTHEEDEDEDEY